jgi:hypothetical protein
MLTQLKSRLLNIGVYVRSDSNLRTLPPPHKKKASCLRLLTYKELESKVQDSPPPHPILYSTLGGRGRGEWQEGWRCQNTSWSRIRLTKPALFGVLFSWRRSEIVQLLGYEQVKRNFEEKSVCRCVQRTLFFSEGKYLRIFKALFWKYKCKSGIA